MKRNNLPGRNVTSMCKEFRKSKVGPTAKKRGQRYSVDGGERTKESADRLHTQASTSSKALGFIQ